MHPSAPSRWLSSTDRWTIEFQGSVVKTKLTDSPRPTPGPDDAHFFRRAYQMTFNQVVMSYPRSERVLLPDGSFSVELSPERLRQIEDEAWVLARELKARRYSTGRRGAVATFSPKSRKRLLEICARLDDDVRGLFLTLTYRANMTDALRAKAHLDLMLRWLRYHAPASPIIWRMEFQERGAIHFHLMILHADWIPVHKVRAHWLSLIEETRESLDLSPGNVDLETIHNRRKAMSYVAKYIAKTPDPLPALRLDYVPYSENGSSGDELPQVDEAPAVDISATSPAFVGRFWGIVGRKHLPLAPLVKFQVIGSPVAWLEFRRLARRYKPRVIRRGTIQGFTLFVNDCWQWLRAWYACEGGRSALAHIMAGEDIALNVSRGAPLIPSRHAPAL